MAKGINKVILIGHLGSDPEVRYMPSGDAMATVSIATTDQWKDKQSGETQERTEWHRVVLFKRLAEIAGEYLRKGRQVYIEGSLRTRKWQDKNGVDRYTTEIVANDMQMLGGRGEGSASFEPREPREAARSQPSGQGGQPAQTAKDQGFDDFDDDIPFARSDYAEPAAGRFPLIDMLNNPRLW